MKNRSQDIGGVHMTVMNQNTVVNERRMFTVKDPISALTHLIGAIGAILGMPALLLQGARMGNSMAALGSYAVFMLSMIILYSASTTYHSFSINARVNKILKKVDHCSIFLLIAGSYTPVAVTVLPGREGMILLSIVWTIAVLGIIFKLCWVTCPKWVSSVIYTAMGWTAIFFMKDIVANLSAPAFFWLLAGGLFYTIGAVIYAMKPTMLNTMKTTKPVKKTQPTMTIIVSVFVAITPVVANITVVIREVTIVQLKRTINPNRRKNRGGASYSDNQINCLYSSVVCRFIY